MEPCGSLAVILSVDTPMHHPILPATVQFTEPLMVGGTGVGVDGGGGGSQLGSHDVPYRTQHPPPGPGRGQAGLGPGIHFSQTCITQLGAHAKAD